jgi:hypothetical protein
MFYFWSFLSKGSKFFFAYPTRIMYIVKYLMLD